MNEIININNSADDNFNSILKIVEDTLNMTIETFSRYMCSDNSANYLEYLHYDYDSLYTTVVYKLLALLSITYSEGLPLRQILDLMPQFFSNNGSEDETNRKRLERIQKVYDERNSAHAEYLKTTEYTPRLTTVDASWYDLLSEHPLLNRFLHKEEAIITKKFFEELDLVYDAINTRNGYDRYHLFHKLEMSSKLEMFYKTLALIKKEKRRLKLSDEAVKNMIDKMYYLHVVPNKHPITNILLNCDIPNRDLFYEILNTSKNELNISCIVFNVDNLIESFLKKPISTSIKITELNFILNTVVYHLCNKIENELAIIDNKLGFKLIYDIQQCNTSTNFFEQFLNNNSIICFEKNCSEEITFTHFKRIYKIKQEK